MAVKRSQRARKRLIIATAATVVILGSGFGFWGIRKAQLRTHRAALRVQGLQDARAGNNEKAADELWSYLQADPDDREVLENYANAQLNSPLPRGEHIIKAIRAFRRLKLLQPARQDINVKLCDLYLQAGAFTELLDLADETLKQNPNEVAALRGKTMALDRLGRKDKAHEAAEAWLKAAPNDTTAMLMVVQTLIVEGQTAERAMERADALVKARPDDVRAQFVRGVVLRSNRRLPEAVDVFKKLAPRVTDDQDLAARLANEFDVIGDSDDAAKLLNETLKKTNSPRVRLLLARRAFESARFDDAIALTASPSPETADEAQTINAVAKALKTHDATPIKLADAGWTAVASALLNHTAATEAENRKAIADIQSINTNNDIGPYPLFAVAVYTAALGETEHAIDGMDQVARMEPAWAVPFKIASDLSLRSGAIEKSKNYAEMAWQRHQTDLGANLILARSLYAEFQNDPTTNTDLLFAISQNVQKNLPGEPTTLLICLDLLGRRKKTAEAKAMITDNVLKSDKATEEAILGAALLSQTYNLDSSDQCLALAEKRFGKTPRWRTMTATALARAGKVPEGLALIQEGIPTASPDDKIRLTEASAQYAEATHLPNAVNLWSAAVDASPTNVNLVAAAAASDSVAKDPKLLDSVIQRLKAIEGPKGVRWRLAQAKSLLRQKTQRSNEDAAVLLGEVVALNPTPEVHMLLAQAMTALGNTANAIAQLNAAVRLDPNNARTRLLLAALLQSKNHDVEGAKKQLEAAIASEPKNTAVRAAAADILASQGDVNRAIELIETVPNRNRDQLALLGELYERAGKTDKAGQVANAMLADSNDPRALLLKARTAHADGKSDEAEKALAALDHTDLPPAQRKLLLAKYYAEVADFPRAAQLAEEVMKEDPKVAEAYRLRAIIQLNARDTAGAAATAEASASAGINDPALKALLQQRDNINIVVSRGMMPLTMELLTRPEDAKVIRTVHVVTEADPVNVQASVGAVQAAAAETTGDFALQHALIRTLLYLGRVNEAAPLAANLARALPFSQDAALLWVETESIRGNDQALLDSLNWLDSRSTPMPDALALSYVRVLRINEQFDKASTIIAKRLELASAGGNRVPWLVEYGLTAYARGKKNDFDRKYDDWAAAEKTLPEAWGVAASREIAPVDILRWLQTLKKSVGPTVDLAFAADTAARRSSNADLNAWAEAAVADLYAKSATLPATNRIDIAVFQEQHGHPDTAETTYRTLLDDPTYGPPAKNNLAVLLSRRGAHDEAIALAESALKTAPNSADFLDTLGTVQDKAGKNAEALATMDKVIHTAPGSPSFRIHYAHALLINGKVAEAKVQLAEVKAQGLNRPPLVPVAKAELDELEKGIAAASK